MTNQEQKRTKKINIRKQRSNVTIDATDING